MRFKRTRRTKPGGVYAFIDSQNLNVSTQKDGWKMNWQKFREFLASEYGVTTAFMFIGYVPEFEPMYEQLHKQGFAVVLKQTFDMTKPVPDDIKNGEDPEKMHIKGNVDAELVLWAMKELPNYSKAVIVSGDGDFFCLVEYLQQRGKLLKLLTPNEHYSSLYNKYSDFVHPLTRNRRELRYHDRKRRRR